MDNKKIPMRTKIVTLIKVNGDNYIFGKDKKYIIPEYQRDYSWSEKEIEDFLVSISRAVAGEQVFMGTVQFAAESENSNEYSVIDGQQRLTTFLLFCMALETKYGFDITGLNGMQIDIRNFELNNDKLKNAFSDDIQNNRYAQNFKLIKQFVDENEIETDIVFENLYFVELTTVDMPLPDVVGIFNTINTTGLDLDCSDLFKLQYYEFLKKYKHEDRMKDICSLYDEMNKDNINMRDVLDIYKHCIAAKFRLGFDKVSSSNERFFDEVFKKSDYKDAEILNYDEFKKIAQIYKKYKNYDINSIDTFASDIIWITRYGRYWTLPYVCYYLNGGEYHSALSASMAIGKYMVINSVLFAKSVNSVNTFICSKVFPCLNDTEKVKELINTKISEISTKDKERFQPLLRHDLKDNNKRAYIICTLAALIEEKHNGSSISEIRKMLFDWNNFKYDIEHIKAYENFKTDENRSEFNGIGNLVVLDRNINRAVKDIAVGDKIKRYKDSSLTAVKNVISRIEASNNIWEITQVRARADEQEETICEFVGLK